MATKSQLAALELGRPYRWRKGESGNPRGRPPRNPLRRTLRELLSSPEPGAPRPRLLAERLIDALVAQGFDPGPAKEAVFDLMGLSVEEAGTSSETADQPVTCPDDQRRHGVPVRHARRGLRPRKDDFERFLLVRKQGYSLEQVAEEESVPKEDIEQSVRRADLWDAMNAVEELGRQEVARLRAHEPLRHQTMEDAYTHSNLDVRLRAVEMDNKMVEALTRKAPKVRQETQVNIGDAAAQVSERSFEGRLRKILERRRQASDAVSWHSRLDGPVSSNQS